MFREGWAGPARNGAWPNEGMGVSYGVLWAWSVRGAVCGPHRAGWGSVTLQGQS